MPRVSIPVSVIVMLMAASQALCGYRQAAGFPWAFSLTSTGQFLGVAVDPASGDAIAIGTDDAQDRFGTIRRSRICGFNGGTGQYLSSVTFSGPTGSDEGVQGVAVDAAGNVIAAGSADLGEGEAWLVRKYTAGGLVWSRTSVGATFYIESEAKSVAIDTSGNIIAAGRALQSPGGWNWLVVKYDPAGEFVWSRSHDGEEGGADGVGGLAVDTAGNVYAAGYEDRNGANGNRNWLVRKYDPGGADLWSRSHNGEADGVDAANAVAVDTAGNALVAGYETRDDVSQERNWLVMKYDGPSGNILWSRTYNSPADDRDEAYGIGVDPADNSVVAVGRERRSDLDQKHDWLVMKYDASGALLWSRTHNGVTNGNDSAQACAVDSGGGVLVGGYEDCGLEWCSLGWVRSRRWMLRDYDSAGAFVWAADAPIERQETAGGLGIDARNWVWMAGRQLRPRRGQDVLVQVYSVTQTGRAMSASLYDYANGDEGPPCIWVGNSVKPGLSGYESEMFVSFSTASTVFASSTDLTTWFATGPFESDWTEIRETMAGGASLTAAGVTRLADHSPVTVGTVTANGVDQFLGIRELREYAGNAFEFKDRVTATYWSGSTVPIVGRAVAPDSLGGYWAAAEQESDLLLFRYTDTGYSDSTAGEKRARIVPGYPRRRVTTAVDRIRAGANDSMGNVWFAGGTGNDGALWKFSPAGELSLGSPVTFPQGVATILHDLVVDGRDNVLATGECGQNAVFVGVDNTGEPLPGLETPLILSRAPERLTGAGVVVEPGGAVWLAATLDADPSSSLWIGSAAALFRLEYVSEEASIPAGNVVLEVPGGAVVNLLRGERLTILAHPTEGGEIRMRVMTMRGEPVWEESWFANGHEVVTLSWDGRNSAGREVATGAYAVRIVGAGLEETMRAAVIRR